jgi:exonuclease SbcC
MSTLEKVEICNYQSIDDLSLDLGPWTVLVGSSNSGKSAVLRALRDLFQNADSPAVVRVGAKHFEVKAHLSDTLVSLTRGKAQSTYGVDGEVYAKSGRSVPAPVSEALRIPAEGVWEHYAAQLDPPYLLSLPASQIASLLAELTESDRIGRAVSEINKRKMSWSRTREIRAGDAERAKATLEAEYADLPQTGAALEKAKQTYDGLKDDLALCDGLEAVLKHHTTLTQTLASLTSKRDALAGKVTEEATMIAHRAGERLASVTLLDEALSKHRKLVTGLRDQRTRKESAEQAQASLKEQVAEFEALVSQIPETETCPMCGSKVPAGTVAS